MKQDTLAGQERLSTAETGPMAAHASESQAAVPLATTEIVRAESKSVTPMALIEMAVAANADVDKLAKLMELQITWEANEARKAFVAAMAAFKADPPSIVKNRKVAFGQTAYEYATLDQACHEITLSLSKRGISHRWKVSQEAALIKVTCVLTHNLGHSEETTLSGAADTSGSKNAIQAIGSAVTYLERYSLLAATGLAAKNGDDDGQGGVKWDKLQEFLESISTAPNLQVLEQTFKAGVKEALALKNNKAAILITEAKDARKKVLTEEKSA